MNKENREGFFADLGDPKNPTKIFEKKSKEENKDLKISNEKKFCSNCGSKINIKTEICPKCGVRVKALTSSIKSPGLAAVLSFFIPGLGQIYNGAIAEGIVLMILTVISLVLCLAMIGFILVPAIWIYAIYDAYNTSKKDISI